MSIQKNKFRTSAKQASIMAISAALYFSLNCISQFLPIYAILYLPVILLGVFPFWFGWGGLAGCMIGANMAGIFIMGMGFFSIFESVTVLIMYSLIWLLAPQKATERGKKNTICLICVYMVSLFLGTSFHNLIFASFIAFFTLDWAFTLIFSSFVLNIAIELAICPVLIRTLSPRLRCWGIYSSTFSEWRSRTRRQLK